MTDSFEDLIKSHLIKSPRTALQSQAESEEGVLPVSWLGSHYCPPSSLHVSGLKRHPSFHTWISSGKVRTQPLKWWVSVSQGPRELLAWLELLSHRKALTPLLCSFPDHVSELGIRCWSSFVDLNLCEKNCCCYLLSCFGGVFVGMKIKVNALFVLQGCFFNSTGVPAYLWAWGHSGLKCNLILFIKEAATTG